MLAELGPAAAGFHADQTHARFIDEGMKDADRVAAAAHTREDGIGQAILRQLYLAHGFLSDYFMKVADHDGIRVRAESRAQQVVGGRDVGDPVAHGFAYGVLKGPAAVGYGYHFGAQQTHAEDVETLAPHVLFAHVDGAIEAEKRADRCRSDAMLAGAGFGDNAFLPHAPREQRLSDTVVDFVRAGVQQVLTLEVDFRAAES